MRRLVLFVLVLVIWQSAFAQERFILPNLERDPNEVSVAISQTNPANIIAGSNIAALYVSHDSGRRWRNVLPSSTYGIWGDPVLLAHPSGSFFYAHLSKTEGKKHPHWIDRIVVQRSNDSGNTWSNGVAIGHNGDKAQDKPWLSVDGHKESEFYGRVYLSWTEFDRYGSDLPEHRSRIRFTALNSEGMESNESSLINVVSDHEGDCLDGNQTPEGATVVAMPTGRIALVWAFDEKIWLDVSDDGGRTWGKDRVIAVQNGGWRVAQYGVYRSNNFPFTAWTPGKNSAFGRIWVGYGAIDETGKSSIYLKFSDDGGESWSEEMEIPKPAGSACDRFMPHLTADVTSGELLIVYYDRCFSKTNKFMDVSMTNLQQGADQGIQTRLTSGSFAPAGEERFFGDYIGTAAKNGFKLALWTEHREGKLLLAGWRNTNAHKPPKPNKKVTIAWFVEHEHLHYHISSASGYKGKLVIRFKGLSVFNRRTVNVDTNDPDFESTFVISSKDSRKTLKKVKLKPMGS